MNVALKILTKAEKKLALILNPRALFSTIQRRVERSKKESIKKSMDIAAPFEKSGEGIFTRKYVSSEAYRDHQITKLRLMEDRLQRTYSERLEFFVTQFSPLSMKKGSTVLCLGSRDGAEVGALRREGMLAIGIDLIYPEKNEFVHYGDFHNIPYPDSCFDYVYTNTLDHLLDPHKLFKEVNRVLKKNGSFVPAIVNGLDEGFDLMGSHESFAWNKKEDLIPLIEKEGFRFVKKLEHRNNWWIFEFGVDS